MLGINYARYKFTKFIHCSIFRNKLIPFSSVYDSYSNRIKRLSILKVTIWKIINLIWSINILSLPQNVVGRSEWGHNLTVPTQTHCESGGI